MAKAQMKWMAGGALAGFLAATGASLAAMPMAPVNNLPNPYESVDNWFKLPGGRNGAPRQVSRSRPTARAFGRWTAAAATVVSIPNSIPF